MSELNPVAIILVTSGTRGDRLLFRYPFESENVKESSFISRQNPYALKISEDRLSEGRKQQTSTLIHNSMLVGFEDKTLANLLAVKTRLCGSKFNVKIDEVRFVGFPVQLEHSPKSTSKQQQTQNVTGKHHRINTVNAVFALRANIIDSAIDCYHTLAKQLIVALRHEEERCQYLSLQSKIIRSVFDEVAALPEDCIKNPFRLILQRSQIAKELKQVYVGLVERGMVSLHINRWIEVNFCMPHKVHVIVTGSHVIHLEPEDMKRCLSSLRPYHGLLFLQPEGEVLDSLPMDASPALVRMIKMVTPLKNLQTLALDCDLSLSQVFALACHLVYWGKARVIYPLCESNVYILSPMANTLVNSTLVEDFVEHFPGRSLHLELSEFSLPCLLREKRDMLEHPQLQAQRVQIVVWMLQQGLLMQLHTYIFFVRPDRKGQGSFGASISIAEFSSSNIHPQVVEESFFSYVMDDHTNLERAPSMSDVASINSDESASGLPVPSAMILPGLLSSMTGKHLSKSPSLEVSSDGTIVTEEMKAQWQKHGTLLKELSAADKAAVLKCPAAKNLDDLQLFARLFPYFNGKHHLEEIMFYENIRRSQLLTLLDKFKDVLITCCHQDLATTFYVR
ncbi:GATOR complex protein NPRL3-like [Pomacea canaliculata]|uniref:GATOR complex protein NPRL3-like n=1 Tax=Pomacea canaliculata TaxID=400727 RepID=UPI000D732AA9|nr:GATOR complex protein NPRL3-like [Pomacea canaliculata]